MSRTTRLLFSAAALLGLYLLFGHRLAARDLWSSHEARAAMDAASLLAGDGPPLVPRLFDGTPELQKPPLYYGLVALLGWPLGGVDALAVRLPATLAGIGCVLLLGLWLAARGRALLGLLAATVLATAVHFALLARTGRIDLPLAFTTLAAVIAFVEALRCEAATARRWRLLAGYVAVAAGILLKGPVALALVLAALVPWLLGERRASPGRLELWWGLPLVALLVLPWLFWLDAHTDGAFFRVFLWEHNLDRGLGTGRLRSYPAWYYFPVFAVEFLPWSPLLLAGVVLAVWRGWARDDAELRLGLASLGGMFALLSLAAFKRADYLAPLYPWAALVAGVALERLVARLAWQRLVPVACLGVLLVAGTGQAIYADTLLARAEPTREYATFAAAIRAAAHPGEPVALFRAECHPLAFHLGPGRPILIEWRDLRALLPPAGTLLVVLPPESADELPTALPGVAVERLGDNAPPGGRHKTPLLLLRLRDEGTPCPSCPSCRRSPTSP